MNHPPGEDSPGGGSPGNDPTDREIIQFTVATAAGEQFLFRFYGHRAVEMFDIIQAMERDPSCPLDFETGVEACCHIEWYLRSLTKQPSDDEPANDGDDGESRAA